MLQTPKHRLTLLECFHTMGIKIYNKLCKEEFELKKNFKIKIKRLKTHYLTC